jgi:hypothetical protein
MNGTAMVNVDTLKVSAGHSYTLVSGNANLGHGQFMADIPRPGLKDQLQLAPKQIGVEIGADG